MTKLEELKQLQEKEHELHAKADVVLAEAQGLPATEIYKKIALYHKYNAEAYKVMQQEEVLVFGRESETIANIITRQEALAESADKPVASDNDFYIGFEPLEPPDRWLNRKNRIDGLQLLSKIGNETIATAFFDPQYRGVLDKLNYGQHRMKQRFDLQQMDEETIIRFIKEINRTLKKSGHLFLWVDKYHLCQGIIKWIAGTSLNVVDMITWDKGKIGMGYRTRRKSEYLLVLQKSPVKAKGFWNDHGIPDVWVEKASKGHPHTKPVELQRRLIAATTKVCDYVLDPAAGSFSVFEACKLLGGVDFIGGDIDYGCCEES